MFELYNNYSEQNHKVNSPYFSRNSSLSIAIYKLDNCSLIPRLSRTGLDLGVGLVC